ncbi:hypothetical protein POM88_003337 [Heracleum sosnowskyi]|uniref:Uncharacterized protein n=1 Tax=Heracleum sosnowskyi TaxID=360622 RepID=A0AAD8JG57_9APIA|nr:hypothetical protein POM88_003337 [Heracleum sosnowskyi]
MKHPPESWHQLAYDLHALALALYALLHPQVLKAPSQLVRTVMLKIPLVLVNASSFISIFTDPGANILTQDRGSSISCPPGRTTISAALPPLSSTPGFSTLHNIDIGSSMPPISSSLPNPFGDLAPLESADQAPSESVTPVISYNLSSAAEQLSKNHIWVKSRCIAYNLGTSRGTSVLEMVVAFEKASGKKIPVKLCEKRPGDATVVYASTEKTERELGWK